MTETRVHTFHQLITFLDDTLYEYLCNSRRQLVSYLRNPKGEFSKAIMLLKTLKGNPELNTEHKDLQFEAIFMQASGKAFEKLLEAQEHPDLWKMLRRAVY